MAATLQFKMTLRNILPPIWRRIRVSPELTLAELHHVIQILFGWSESHLWQFEIALQTYADYEDEFDELDLVPAKTTRLADLPAALKRFAYNYDFGDDWWVEIAIEPGAGSLYSRNHESRTRALVTRRDPPHRRARQDRPPPTKRTPKKEPRK